MSTALHDVPTQAKFGHTIAPDSYTESEIGRTIDLIDGDGPCFLIGSLLAFTTPEPVTVEVEESSDQSSWTAVSIDPEITISASFDGTVSSRFTRTKRYVRASITAEADSELRAAILIGQQKKTV